MVPSEIIVVVAIGALGATVLVMIIQITGVVGTRVTVIVRTRPITRVSRGVLVGICPPLEDRRAHTRIRRDSVRIRP
jgi:hypothetical protein